MIKGSLQQEAMALVNTYVPSIGAPKYIKQVLTDMKGKTDGNTVIVQNCDIPLSPVDRSSRQKISKEMLSIKTCWTNSSRTHFLLQCSWSILQERAYVRQKTGLNKVKKTVIVSSIFLTTF